MATTRRKLIQYAGFAGEFLPPAHVRCTAAEDLGVNPAAFAAVFAKRQTVRRYKSNPIPKNTSA